MKNRYLLAVVLVLCAPVSLAQTLMVKVVVDGEQHQVVDAWLLEQDYPPNFQRPGQGRKIDYHLMNSNQRIEITGQVDYPALAVKACLLASEEERQNLAERNLVETKGTYFIRIPGYTDDLVSLQLSYPDSNRADEYVNSDPIPLSRFLQ
ncbi:hypothetical protein QSV34_00405 [Porticoccus sp. W117]|uniref:hypothetical protein n=1 Tax=Porticoccus sp. W117 TaxID=3054777 RepID=UPI002594C8F1|nr:hypothetical protein [Porticoccus sp. W117]MDM3869803.1 hypothetical protein [Porticoccus sp. W117]